MKAEPHFVSIKKDKDRRTNVAYEGIGLQPTSILTERIVEEYMENFLANPANTSNTSTPGDADMIHEEPPDPISPNHTSSAMIFSVDQPVAHSTPPTRRDNALAKKDFDPLASQIQSRIFLDSTTLASRKQALLSKILARVGPQHITAAQLHFAPPWILK